jgi:hypothetical protein
MAFDQRAYQLFARILLPVRYSLDFDRLTSEDQVMRGCARFLDGEVSHANFKFYASCWDRKARHTNICECAEPCMPLKRAVAPLSALSQESSQAPGLRGTAAGPRLET